MKIEEMFYISEKDWYKLQGWASLAYKEDKNEISGLMTAVPQKDGRFKIGDVEILKQENSGANTELDGDAVTQYTMKYGMKYNNPEMKFVWWHSHHIMAAFWSGTDVKEIEAWENNSFSLALVINLREEYKFRVSIWKAGSLPVEQHYDTTLTIKRKEPKVNITNAMKKKYEELCSEEKPTYNINHYNGYGYRMNHNPRQMVLGQKNESALNIEVLFTEALKEAESMQDAMVDGSLSLKGFSERIKRFNARCKEHKCPFVMITFKGSQSEIVDKLMTMLPADLLEWEDSEMQAQAETMAWNNSFGGYNGY